VSRTNPVRDRMVAILEGRVALAVKHCVTKVAAKDGDASRAFAICTASKNKGHLRMRGRHKKDPKKLKKYEKLLAKNRKK
jgi:hypothetical protein